MYVQDFVELHATYAHQIYFIYFHIYMLRLLL